MKIKEELKDGTAGPGGTELMHILDSLQKEKRDNKIINLTVHNDEVYCHTDEAIEEL